MNDDETTYKVEGLWVDGEQWNLNKIRGSGVDAILRNCLFVIFKKTHTLDKTNKKFPGFVKRHWKFVKDNYNRGFVNITKNPAIPKPPVQDEFKFESFIDFYYKRLNTIND